MNHKTETYVNFWCVVLWLPVSYSTNFYHLVVFSDYFVFYLWKVNSLIYCIFLHHYFIFKSGSHSSSSHMTPSGPSPYKIPKSLQNSVQNRFVCVCVLNVHVLVCLFCCLYVLDFVCLYMFVLLFFVMFVLLSVCFAVCLFCCLFVCLFIGVCVL